MQLHNIKPKTKRRKPKNIGRGATRGTYSGKGIKGQKARAGRKMRPEMRDIIKKIHKKRGYAFSSIQKKPTVINIGAFNVFPVGSKVSPLSLVQGKMVRAQSGAVPTIKILSGGDIKHALIFSGFLFSEEARKKIEKAGGKIDK